MKILILNANNPLKESGIVALDLFNHLKGSGQEVRLVVNCYNGNYPDGIISTETLFMFWLKTIIEKIEWRRERLKNLLKFRVQKKPDPNYCFFELDEHKQFFKTNTLLNKAKIKPDIIFVLYAKNFINIKNIYELSKKTNAKIFWLMYDMAPFTGGCHYAWECTGYKDNCGKCPGLFSSDPFDITYKNLLFKKEYFDKMKMEIIAASEWQYRQAKKSSLFINTTIHKILLSVDSSVFKPVNKGKLRIEMTIPVNKKIIFFGALGLTDLRKGMYYLIESLKLLKERIRNAEPELENNILLLIAGKHFDAIVDSLPFESHYLGYVDNNSGIASAYQVSDIFICPSIEDSGPMMVNQSIMSGTPVVSFETGVSLDLVITGETGYRAKMKDSVDLAEGIYGLLKLNAVDYSVLSLRCREHALKLISPEARKERIESIISN
jgi:glycosyltransferase involved in cell wall biosynthesis